jgi:nucleotide-binding universal stress UspA family protein
MLKSILLALDLTDASGQAERLALDLAARHKARITGVSVIDVPYLTAPEPMPIGGAYFKFAKDAALLEQAHAESQARLAAFTEACRERGIEGEAVSYDADPYEALRGAADLHDLVVIGRDSTFHHHSREPVGRPVARLLKSSPRPLIVAPPNAAQGEGVLLAYDGSIPSMRVLQLLALLGLCAGPLHVVSVADEKKPAEDLARRAREFLVRHGCTAEAHGIGSDADPADLILAECQSRDVRLLAMGAFGHTGWRETIMGTCTRRLLEASAVPIFVSH